MIQNPGKDLRKPVHWLHVAVHFQLKLKRFVAARPIRAEMFVAPE